MPLAELSHVDAMSRVIQGIMTGVGFIGAGVIIRNQADDKIHGLTTAAAVWITAAMGALCGIGEWKIIAALSVIVAIVLLTGGQLSDGAIRSATSQESRNMIAPAKTKSCTAGRVPLVGIGRALRLG